MASFKLAAAAAAILLFVASASLSLADRPGTIPTYSDIELFAISPIPLLEDPIAKGPESPKHGHLAPGGDDGAFELLDCLDILEEGGASTCLTTVLRALTLKGPLPTGQCCRNVLKLSMYPDCWPIIAGPKVLPAFEPLFMYYCEKEEGLVSPPPSPYLVMSS